MTLVGDFVTGQTVTFQRARKLLFDQGGGIQEGVVNANDLKVSQRGAGANMSVDIATGFAWIQIDTGTNNGLAHITSDAVTNVVITAAHATLPRLDQIVARYNDTALPTGSGNIPTLEVVTGTATSGTTLDLRTGATALPNDCLRIADILVPAASTSVVTANIRDRRTFARGTYYRTLYSAGAKSTASTSMVDIDNGLVIRSECSGVPVRLSLMVSSQHTIASAFDNLGFAMDTVLLDGTSKAAWQQQESPSASTNLRREPTWTTVPATGSHLFSPQFAVTTAGTITLPIAAATPLVFVIEEIVRQNANNI